MIKICTFHPHDCGLSAVAKAKVDALLQSDLPCRWVDYPTSVLPLTRTRAARELESDDTHILMLDSDVWHEDVVLDVTRMIGYNVDIVGGKYQMRGGDNANACQLAGKYFRMDATGLYEALWVAAGALLIHRDVIESLPGDLFRTWVVDADGEIRGCPEDVGFCMYAVNSGFDVHFDADCKTIHPIYTNPKTKVGKTK